MTTPQSDARREIPALTGLRGVAALWVFLYHVRDISRAPLVDRPIEWLGAAGYMGVDVFFVLSGFVLAWNYSQAALHRTARGWSEFLWKRLARIYPAHLGALALFGISLLLLISLDVPSSGLQYVSPLGFVESLFLVQAWTVPTPGVWNLVAWSISCEWAAYLCFPLIAAAAMQLRTPSVIVATIAALFAVLAFVILSLPDFGILGHGMSRIVVEFTAGVLLCRLLELSHAETATYDRLAIVGLVLMIAGGNAWAVLEGRAAPFPWIGGLACLIVVGLAGATGLLARALSGPLWQYAGRLSYCFYLVHWLVVRFTTDVLKVFGQHKHPGWSALALFVAFAVSWALAHWLHRSIELPARRAMLARTSGAAQPAAAMRPG